MFKDDINAVCNTAKGKMNLLQEKPMAYLLLSVLAGIYIAFGSILMGFVGGCFSAAGSPATKLVCGLVFSVGLCFITMAGAELFTGNNLVMFIAGMKKTVTWGNIIKLWAVCWIGNLIGSVLTSVLFTLTGIPGGGDAGAFFSAAAAAKMSGAPMNLFAKAILCNMCVCGAIWCGARMKSEGAKMFINFCFVTTFVTCGFEHSVANMTFLTVGLLNPNGAAVSMMGYWYNLLIVTLGNMVGGIVFIALPYYLVAKEK